MPTRARHHRRLGIARYAAIWHKVTGLAWAVRNGLTAAEYQQAFNELVAKGFRPKMVSGTGILVNLGAIEIRFWTRVAVEGGRSGASWSGSRGVCDRPSGRS